MLRFDTLVKKVARLSLSGPFAVFLVFCSHLFADSVRSLPLLPQPYLGEAAEPAGSPTAFKYSITSEGTQRRSSRI
jgi:hypothetical protein